MSASASWSLYDRVVGFRIPATALIGAVGILAAGGAVLGVETAPSRASSAEAFAKEVLGEATVPPGGQPTAGIHTVDVRWLGGWGGTPGVQGVFGVHAFYLYDEPLTTVADYIEKHPPPGVRTTGSGTANGVVTSISETVPVSGPSEYAAWLTYSVAPTNSTLTRSELRIDAKTVWVPRRPAFEKAPGGGVVEVTGFKSGSPRAGARGAVTVVVSTDKARALIRDLNSLTLGASTFCLEAIPLWSVTIRPSPRLAPSFVARSEGCDGLVTVTMSGRREPVLSDRACLVLRDVGALLPADASSTRSAAASCARAAARR
jgi:hypothetical protein